MQGSRAGNEILLGEWYKEKEKKRKVFTYKKRRENENWGTLLSLMGSTGGEDPIQPSVLHINGPDLTLPGTEGSLGPRENRCTKNMRLKFESNLMGLR